jgi:PIN domain nuclease of toxin-antitoxin system
MDFEHAHRMSASAAEFEDRLFRCIFGLLVGASSEAVKGLIQDADIVYASTASVFEIAIKTSNSKLAIRIDGLTERLAAANFEPRPVTWAHAQRALTSATPIPSTVF